MTEYMPCPQCDHPQTCPCKSCQERHPTEIPWIWDGDFISCGHCGLRYHVDWWQDREIEFHGIPDTAR